MKKALLTPLAALLLVGCADNEFLGTEEAQHTVNGDKPILFTSESAPMTRALKEGADAATLLGNNYVVFGTKGTERTKVFDHYNINWFDNTKGSTETNVADWEYVGQKLHPNNTLPEGAGQFIKYWDLSAAQYDFIAFSYGKENKEKTITSGSKTVPYPVLSTIDPSKLGQATTGTPVYTVTGKVADLVNTYVADLVTVPKDDYLTTTVKPKFRQMGSKVRIAIYETVAGYAVKDVKFHTSDTRATTPSTVPVLYAGSAVLPDITANTEGTMKVYFPTVGLDKAPGTSGVNTDYNKAHVVFAGSTDATSGNLTSTLKFQALSYSATTEGVLNKKDSGKNYLGTTSNEATYATTSDAAAAYELVLPYGAGNDLKLHVDYTLVSVDGSGETINVKSASALVPAVYTNWQPNYAYTYIFKISKDSNGTTGNPGTPGDPSTPGDPAGLYPITFDAVVMDFDEEHVQETITTVADPSITTYSKGVDPTNASEYTAGKNIYVSVKDASGDLLSASNFALYTAKVEDAKDSDGNVIKEALQGIDENSIANALKNGTPNTTTSPSEWTVTDANGGKLIVKSAGISTDGYVTQISAGDAPDGNAISGKFYKFTPSAGTYVFEYKASDGKKHYKIIIVH